eukprot:TRINITY_DN8144_c0_g1_i2.p1 TRINITY_DN8144_c0_g1~~TRINITY_DN8144_c0_g1_i2.p1  ORF type:complete len:698 (+),score=99.18 TRINITY_DN8144_c0_g1_i2:164-2095(+)
MVERTDARQERLSLPLSSPCALPTESSSFFQEKSSFASAPCVEGGGTLSTPPLLGPVAPVSAGSLPLSSALMQQSLHYHSDEIAQPGSRDMVERTDARQERLSLPLSSPCALPTESSSFFQEKSSFASAPCVEGGGTLSTPPLLGPVAPVSAGSTPLSNASVARDEHKIENQEEHDKMVRWANKFKIKRSTTAAGGSGSTLLVTTAPTLRVERALKSMLTSTVIPSESPIEPRLRIKFWKGPMLDTIMSIVILLNMIYLGMANELELSNGVFATIEVTFACFFVAERLTKLVISGVREYCIGPERGWNAFESVLAFLSVAEMFWSALESQKFATPLLRALRLARIVKIVRVLRIKFFSELMQMVNGVFGGGRTLFWSSVLISFPLYVLAIVLVEFVKHGDPHADRHDGTENFASVQFAFFTLFRCTVVGDCSDIGGRPIFYLLAASHGWGFAFVYVISIMVVHIGLLNVIVAIYVEKTTSAAKRNDLVMKRERLEDDAFFQEKTHEVVCMAFGQTAMPTNKDDDRASRISAEDFGRLCTVPRFRTLLTELDIAEEDQLDLFDTLDVDVGGTVDKEEMVSGIAKLRGDARRADVISVALALRSLQCAFLRFESDVRSFMKRQERSHVKLSNSRRSSHTPSLEKE